MILRCDWREESDRVKGAFAVAGDLAEKIDAAGETGDSPAVRRYSNEDGPEWQKL